jgi:hypothetical protein
MDRPKLLKIMTLGMSAVMFSPMLIMGLGNLLPQSEPPVRKESAPVSQDAQIAANENGYLDILQKEPNNPTAIGELERIAATYAANQKLPQAIGTYQKLVKAAPKSPQVKLYQQRIADLQKSGQNKSGNQTKPAPTTKPSSKP